MISRIIIGILLLAGMLLLLWQGNVWVWQLASLAVLLLAAREWAEIGGLEKEQVWWYVGFCGLFIVFGGWLLWGNEIATHAILLAACVWWALFAPWSLRKGSQNQISRLWFLSLGMLLLFSAWQAAAMMYINNIYALIAVFAVVWISDSLAYFVGKLLGRNKIAPKISPGKTWEGCWGGMTAAILFAYFVGPLYFSSLPPIWLAAAAAALSGIGILGDLYESSIKRRAYIKDSGTILGSHGGVLDRIDALLPTLPFAALMASWLS